MPDSIVLVPHGAGNIGSLMELFHGIGRFPKVATSPEQLLHAGMAVVPGVGASGSAMRRLHETGFAEGLAEMHRRGQPMLGICVGAQIMFQELQEDHCTGLGLLPGKVSRIANNEFNNGWSGVRISPPTQRPVLLKTAQKNFYFNHGYQIDTDARMQEHGITTCDKKFTAYFLLENLCGVQFHPEKSQIAGIAFIENAMTHYGL